MSLRVTIEGQGSVEIAKECVKKVIYKTDIPLDSNARTKDVGSTLEITGKATRSTPPGRWACGPWCPPRTPTATGR